MLKRGVFTWSRKTISRSRLHGVSIHIQDYRWHSSRAMVIDGSNFRTTSHLATSSSPARLKLSSTENREERLSSKQLIPASPIRLMFSNLQWAPLRGSGAITWRVKDQFLPPDSISHRQRVLAPDWSYI